MEQFKAWWESTTQREQQLVIATTVVLFIAVLYWGIWKPLSDQLGDSQAKLTRAEATLNWTQEKATFLLNAGVGKAPEKNVNLTQILNSTARTKRITFSRIQNKTEQIEVWIASIPFEEFIQWLTLLNNEHGISVVSVDLTKTDKSGYIKVDRLLLEN